MEITEVDDGFSVSSAATVAKVYVVGNCRVKILKGSVRILGGLLKKDDETCVYAPRSASLPFLQLDSQSEVRVAPLETGMEGLSHRNYVAFSNLFALPSNTLLTSRFRGTTFELLPSQEAEKLAKAGLVHVMHDETAWNEVAKQACLAVPTYPQGIRLLVTGERKLGKSTLTRFLVNSLLSETPEVLYMDLDPGQVEFGVSGFMSLVSVRKPLNGPPFTHNLPDADGGSTLASLYLGSLSPSDSPVYYVSALLELVARYKEHIEKNAPSSIPPLVIGTMGWTTGLGREFLKAIADAIALPTHVVHLHSSDAPQHELRTTLTEILYSSKASSIGHPSLLTRSQPNANAPEIKVAMLAAPYAHSSVRNQALTNQYAPTALRTLAFMSYLWKTADSNLWDFTKQLSSVRPVYIPFSQVRIMLTPQLRQHTTTYRKLLPLSCVALAHCDIPSGESNVFDRESAPPNTLAFGFIRAVDLIRHQYHIITPLAPEELASVNTIILGNMRLPESLLTEQIQWQSPSSPPPYLTTSTSTSVAAPRKARHNIKRHRTA